MTKSLPALLGLYFGAFWSACKWCWSWVPWGLSLFDIVNPPAAVAPIPWLKCFTQLPSFVVSILQLGLLWGDWDLASKSALVFLQQYLFILNARGKLSKRQRHRVQGFFECVGQEDWGRPISGIYESREMYSALAAKEPDTSPSEEEA